jgi:hypothetical protein
MAAKDVFLAAILGAVIAQNTHEWTTSLRLPALLGEMADRAGSRLQRAPRRLPSQAATAEGSLRRDESRPSP